MSSVEHLVLLPVPACLSLSPVTPSVRTGVSVIMVLSLMVTSVCHRHLVGAITKDAIDKMVNGSGMAKTARVCAPVMAQLV